MIVMILSIISIFLLYVRITSYYQITPNIVDFFDSRLKNYILVLWLLLVLLVALNLLFFLFQRKGFTKIVLVTFFTIIVTFIGCVIQFSRVPNYESYHITPFTMKPTEVEQQINAKAYKLDDFPIYFYDKKSSNYRAVRRKISNYSLRNTNDFGCINVADLKQKLGVKRYNHILRKSNVHSSNALVITFLDSEGHSRIITFNNLQRKKTFRRAVKFLENN